MNENNPSTRQSLSIPIAIILAGALVAGGIYFSGRKAAPANPVPTAPVAVAIKGIQTTDHVLGDPKAKIAIVEYSDLECPFCKQFHATLHQLMNEYGAKGQLSWAFRHFPVHSNSVKEGEAAECAAELGGNDAFWKYSDRVFSQTQSNNGLDLAQLPIIAGQIGLDVTKFTQCLDSDKYAAKIEQQRQDVIAAGAQGTPYSVIFADGQTIPITQGALPYSDMKTIIDAVLKGQ